MSRRLDAEAAARGVVIPQARTLAKYGLSVAEWLQHLADADWVCYVCRRFPSTGKFVTDHQHVRGWSNMPAKERKRYVRGVICWHCNRYLLAGNIDAERAARVAEYLRRYEARMPKPGDK